MARLLALGVAASVAVLTFTGSAAAQNLDDLSQYPELHRFTAASLAQCETDPRVQEARRNATENNNSSAKAKSDALVYSNQVAAMSPAQLRIEATRLDRLIVLAKGQVTRGVATNDRLEWLQAQRLLVGEAQDRAALDLRVDRQDNPLTRLAQTPGLTWEDIYVIELRRCASDLERSAEIRSCEQIIVGDWNWAFGPPGTAPQANGSVSFKPDHSMSWSGDGRKGTWSCGAQSVGLTWTESTDTMTLRSESRMEGSNDSDWRVVGTR